MNRLITLLLLVLLSSQIIAQSNTNETVDGSKKDLKYIGMPVGGISAGQVYLGGDGQLWYWDIFNISKISPGNEGGHRYYLNPLVQDNNFENGFGITINDNGFEYKRPLNKQGFSNISFQGEYPIGKVTYNDPQLPVEIKLNAYTPFIPTDADNSGLPMIVMEYTVINEGNTNIDVSINGWLQNTAGYNHSWLGGDFVDDFAAGVSDAKWEARFNINIGYYF